MPFFSNYLLLLLYFIVQKVFRNILKKLQMTVTRTVCFDRDMIL